MALLSIEPTEESNSITLSGTNNDFKNLLTDTPDNYKAYPSIINANSSYTLDIEDAYNI